MEPKIEKVKFGSITIEGEKHAHDIVIRLNGDVEKRRKKLSKQVYGTSHTISLAEAENVYEEGAERLIIGGGHLGSVKLSREAADYFKGKGCEVEMHPISKAVKVWNKADERCIGLFHVTC